MKRSMNLWAAVAMLALVAATPVVAENKAPTALWDWDDYLDALKPLGISSDQKGLEFHPCNCEEPLAEELPAFVFNQKFTLCSIGGTHQTKKMPAAKWIKLCQQLPGPVVLAGGKEDLVAPAH
jgi:hypothetical protein